MSDPIDPLAGCHFSVDEHTVEDIEGAFSYGFITLDQREDYLHQLRTLERAPSQAPRPRNDHTSLYRLFDAERRLLYIGIAGNPGRRFEQHAGDKHWWGDVAHAALEHFPSREAAMAAERRAIVAERPLHNVIHNQPHRRPAAPVADPIQASWSALVAATANQLASLGVGVGTSPAQAMRAYVANIGGGETFNRRAVRQAHRLLCEQGVQESMSSCPGLSVQ